MLPTPQLVLFLMIGALNTAFSYSVYAAGIWLGLSYVLANFISLVLGIPFSFFTNGRLVFQRFEGNRFPRFLAMWTTIWLLNVGLITLLLPHVSGDAYIAGALAFAVVTVLSFVAQRYWVFGEKSSR